MKKGKLFLLCGLLAVAGASFFAPKTTNAPFIEETKMAVVAMEEAPTESTPAPAPERQWEDKDTGYVIFGITMGLTVALVVTMVVLKKTKKDI